jgi:hypothetical protein
MNFTVTGTTAIPEPSTSMLIAFAALLLILSKGFRSYRSGRSGRASDCEFVGRHGGGPEPSKQCRLELPATCTEAALT